jgi:hypothetical protein
MGAPIQRLRHHIWHWPFLSFLREREPVLGPPETPDNGGLDKVAVHSRGATTASRRPNRSRRRNERTQIGSRAISSYRSWE